nr:hypothetical protein [Candidatus Gracilibacteria bacterium]
MGLLDYIIGLYNNHEVIFFILLVFIIAIESRITIFGLVILSPKLGLNFLDIYLFLFFGELLGDTIHYGFGRFFSKFFINNKQENKVSYVKNLQEKLKDKPTFDLLMIIKYTPPITSIGLIYLGFEKYNFKKFILNDLILLFFSSTIITSILFYFGGLLKNNDNLTLFFSEVLIVFMIIFLTIKYISKFIIKKILKNDS